MKFNVYNLCFIELRGGWNLESNGMKKRRILWEILQRRRIHTYRQKRGERLRMCSPEDIDIVRIGTTTWCAFHTFIYEIPFDPSSNVFGVRSPLMPTRLASERSEIRRSAKESRALEKSARERLKVRPGFLLSRFLIEAGPMSTVSRCCVFTIFFIPCCVVPVFFPEACCHLMNIERINSSIDTTSQTKKGFR